MEGPATTSTRTYFFYMATVNTSAMAAKIPRRAAQGTIVILTTGRGRTCAGEAHDAMENRGARGCA